MSAAQKAQTDITDAFGSGAFQRKALFCGQLAGFVFFSHHLAITVLARPVDHWCSPSPEYVNLSTAEWKNVGIPVEKDGRHSQCLRYDPPLDVEAANRSVEGCSSWRYDTRAKDDSIVSEWDLVCKQAWIVPFQSAVFMGGSLVLAPMLGQTADWTGRRQVVVVAVVAVIGAGCVGLFVRTLISFTLIRFLMAGVAGGVRVLCMVLLFELSVPKHRTFYCTVMHVGVVLAQMFVNMLRNVSLNRVQVQASVMIPTYLLVYLSYIVEESPRWLLAVGKISEAERLVLWASRLNGLESSVAKRRWKRAKSLRQPSNSETSFMDLFLSHVLRSRTIVMSLCWASLQLSAFPLHHTLRRTASEWTQLLVGLLQPLAFVGSYALLTRWGRRPIFSCSLFIQGAVGLLMGISSSLEYRLLENALVVSANCLAILTSITSYLYSMELFPTVLRCTGVSAVCTSGRLCGVVMAIFIHFGLPEREDMAFGVAGAVSVLSGWLACSLPETRGVVLTETLDKMEAEEQAL
ncbi:unnamed protein product, partial [Ixodes hexagonus]